MQKGCRKGTGCGVQEACQSARALGSNSCPLELSGSSENRITLKPGGALDKPGRRVSSSRPSSQKAKKKPSTKSLCKTQAEERQVPYTSSQPTLVAFFFFFMK